MFGRFLYGLIALVSGLGSAQFPAFFQQYLQRLGGRFDQVHSDVERLRQDAAKTGYSLETYISELGSSDNPIAREAAQRELERLENLSGLRQAYDGLLAANPWERPAILARHFDGSIARETLQIFQPALQLTSEAAIYAGFGIVLGLLLFAGGETGARKVAFRIREGTWT